MKENTAFVIILSTLASLLMVGAYLTVKQLLTPEIVLVMFFIVLGSVILTTKAIGSW